MIPRISFVLIAAFWVVMNVLLWRAEYGSHGGDITVPVDLVCRKIVTAPDSSSLSVYQDGQRMGFCEFSTSVEQEMAQLDAEQMPPEGLAATAGYQLRLNGNIALGDFTNRVQFDARVTFSARDEWRRLDLKISMRTQGFKITAVATNQTVSLETTEKGEPVDSREFTFSQLENPATLVEALGGDASSGFYLPLTQQNTSALVQSIHWQAHRERLMVGREAVSVYCLETRIFGNRVVIYVSTLGEILRVELPGNISAMLDQWSRS